MLTKILILTFIGLTYGLTTETSLDLGSQLKVIFDFPEFGEFRLPTVRCELSSDGILNGWLTQTLFFKDNFLLKNFGLIVKAIVDEDGIVSCGLVPNAEEEEIKRKERECREQCANAIDEDTTPSSGGEDSTPSNEGTTPGTGGGGDEQTTPITGEVTTPTNGEETTPITDDVTTEGTGEETSPTNDEENTTTIGGGGDDETTSSSGGGSDEETSSSSEGGSGEESSPSTGGGSGEETTSSSGGGGGGFGKCKKGFIYIREADSCYIFSNYTAQWFDAECACASLGGTLAIINDEVEQFAISGRLSHSNWIGLNDNKLEDDFAWRDGSPLSFTKWSPEGSLNSEEKNCVELSENHNFSWVAERCWEQRRFVCEEAESEDQITTPVCPAGWTLNEEANLCYFVTKHKLAWAAAKLLCEDIGGFLATFHNLDAMDFMKNIMSSVSENAWIGIQSDSEGKWTWGDGSSLDFANWGSGEPKTSLNLFSLLGGSKKYCGEIDHSLFSWSAKDCNTKQRAICKRLPEELPRSQCPEGWEFDGEGNCFKVSSSEADYESSKEFCNLSSFGAKLALPNTDRQNLFVADFLKENNLENVWAGVKVDEASSLNVGFLTGIIHTLFGIKDKDCIQIDEAGSWTAQSCDYKSKFMCSVPKFKSHFMEHVDNLLG